jgi:thymidylate synthase ThyX
MSGGVEDFTADERARLAPHFSNVDGPVFALVDLPETVKGAMFARYSRYPGTLRRLFLDEFADSLPERAATGADVEGGRAAELFERIFVGYGDDSVAQLGGAHIACEWVSNVLTKILQRPRLASYLEQSTRYIAYDAPMPGGGYRYYRDAELGPEYRAAMDALFGAYSEALPRVAAHIDATFPATPGESEPVRRRAVKAKALDLLRGLLPAASLSHMGVYASGQAYEQLILHLLAHPLPEARACGKQMLEAVKAVIPSFVSRVERPGRGDVWVGYLEERRAAERRWTERLGLDRDDDVEQRSSVRLTHVDGDEDRLLAALLFESAGVPEERTLATVSALSPLEREQMLADLVGERTNRRHRPGRGFEALRYRFEIVSDYGAFRDLQRHRMLTVQWQPLTPDLGAEIPEEVADAGCGDLYVRALDRSRAEYERLRDAGFPEAAPYALCLGYRIRYLLDLNAREAMHLTELRSAREGHASYRAVAQAMHSAIAELHPAVAAAMKHVDHSTEPRLERILSEIRGESRRAQLTL